MESWGFAGGLAGCFSNGIMENCYVIATVNSNADSSDTGGLVAFGRESTFENCFSMCNVTTESDSLSISDFIPEPEYADITNCYSVGSLNGVRTLKTYDGSGNEEIVENGYETQAITFQAGINGDSSSQISVDTNFSFSLSVDVSSQASARSALAGIDNCLSQVSSKQTELGAAYNRLESALESISVNINNLTSSRSTIQDADIATESSKYIKNQILQQAAATLLATANQAPAFTLQLIQGLAR